MLENLKKRWGINSNLQVIKIIIVFGITGSLAAWLSKPFISFLNIVDEGTFLSWILRLIIVFPAIKLIGNRASKRFNKLFLDKLGLLIKDIFN